MKKGLINGQEIEQEEGMPGQEPEAGESSEHEAQEPAPVEEQEDAGGEELTPESVRKKLEIPDDLKEAYDRVVVAGMKVMFDESTHEMAMKAMQGDGPIEQRLGQAIAGLMGTLIEQSNKTMPPQLVIPAGVELLVAAGDFLKKSGAEPIDDQQIGEAIVIFVQLVLEQSGVVDPAKLQAMLQGALGEDGEAPEAPPQAPGLINQTAGA